MLAAGLALASTADFTAMAASGDMFEVEPSRTTLQGGAGNAEVKAFAEQMIEDHQEAATRLKNLVNEQGDRTKLYVTEQRLAHKDAVLLHRASAEGGTDANLGAYAQKVVPILEAHARHADKLAQATAAKSLPGEAAPCRAAPPLP